MRSTPIILDRLRHVKYDLQSVWDMDSLMGGEFPSIMNKDVTFEFVRFLLWSGLISEDPALTISDTGRLLLEATTREDHALQDVTFSCMNELIESGWIPREMPEPLPDAIDAPPVNMHEYILQLVTMAEVAGLADSAAIWKHTPNEIADLLRVHDGKEKMLKLEADYRAGRICEMIVRASGRDMADGSEPAWDRFFPGAAKDRKPQSAEDMQNMIVQLNAMCGGEVK